MPAEVANWIAAIPVMVVTVLLLAWALDLMATSIGPRGRRLQTLLDGSYWLGVFFLSLACFLSGAVGVLLLVTPQETAPTWFAVGMGIVAVAGIAAWYLLTFTYREETETGDDR